MTADDFRRWLMLPVILVATFMSGFDVNVVNVALTTLHRDLHAGPVALQLVVGGYSFTYAAFLVTGGRLGDWFGYRKLFLLGMTAFTIASLLCGLAQSPGELVAARLVQGVTAAAMVPQVIALITASFPASERPRALAWLGVVMGLAGIGGQVLGGALLDVNAFGLTWRPIFLVNVPIGLITVTLGSRLIPRRPPGAAVRTGRPRLDLAGAVGISAALAFALIPLVLGKQEGWPAWAWVLLAASVPAMAASLGWERRLARRGAEPLVDLQLFRTPGLAIGLMINFAFMAVLVSMMFVLSILLQTGLGLTPLRAGLTFALFGLLAMVTSITSRRLVPKLGTSILTLGGLVSTAAMLILAIELQALGGNFGALWLQLPLCVMGVGNGLMLPMLVGAVLVGVRPAQAGAVSGVLTATQQFAGAVGVAAIGALFFAFLGAVPSRSGYVSAANDAIWVDLGLLVMLVSLTFLLRRQRPAVAPALPRPVLGQSEACQPDG
jgi:EmrB/QacA subfamily drug resistance transporter